MPFFNFRPSWKDTAGESDTETGLRKEAIEEELEDQKFTISDFIGSDPPDIGDTKNNGDIK